MSTTEFFKLAVETFKKANTLDLIEQLQELREDMVALREDNLTLKTENTDLKSKLAIKSQVVFERGVCWLLEDEMTKDRSKTPICPKCYQVNDTVVRSPIQLSTYGGSQVIWCPNCKVQYYLLD